MSNLLKNKKSISELMKRAESLATNELLSQISGGNENACHDNGLLSDESRERAKKREEERLRKLVLKPCTQDA